MRKIMGAAALSLAITPALAASELDPKAAADFVLSTCLPAVEDLAKVEKIAQEKGWKRLPDVLPPSELVKPRANWKTSEFSVLITDYVFPDKGTYRYCFVGFLPNRLARNGVFEAISDNIELTLDLDKGYGQSHFRFEVYNIAGQNLKLNVMSRDGFVHGVGIGSGPQ
jgi:hypothetical protein